MTTTSAGTKLGHRTHLRPVVGLITAGLLAHLVVAAVCAGYPEGHDGDFARYWALATTSGRPYTDYMAEYPPGALAALTGVARATRRRERFDTGLILLNVLADGLIIAMLAAGWGLEAAALYLVVSVPILSLLYFRMDLWSAAAATIGVCAWARGRHWPGVVAICSGAALKLWPLPFGALFLVRRAGRRPGSPALLIAAGAVGAGLWLWWSGLGGIIQVLTFRGATGWDIESVIGSVWRVAASDSMRLEAGAVRVGRSLPAWSIGLFLATAPPAVWAIWKGASTRRVGTGWIAGVGVVLSGSALLSPQFLGWLLPGAAIAWAEGDRRTAVLVAALVALTVTYRVLHTQQMPGLVILRNVLLLATTLQALAALRAQSRENGTVFRFQADDAPDR